MGAVDLEESLGSGMFCAYVALIYAWQGAMCIIWARDIRLDCVAADVVACLQQENIKERAAGCASREFSSEWDLVWPKHRSSP